MAAIGILFVAQLWLGLYRQPEEWPWLYVFLMFTLGFFVVTNTGRSLGLDALLTRATWSVQAGGPNRPPIPRGYLRSVPPWARRAPS